VSSSLNLQIEEAAVRRAKNLLDVLGDSADLKDKMRAITLDALLFARLFESGPRRSIYAEQLLENLSAHGIEAPPMQAFRSDVIGGLRDRQIVIAGTSEGYRLAISAEDISDYLEHTERVVGPMLDRVVSARVAVKQDTMNRHDILENEDAVLRAIVSAFTEAQVLPRSTTDEGVEHLFSEEAQGIEP
jgi:hypothetical protein